MSDPVDIDHLEGWIKETSLFRQHQHRQEEINLHKWYQSEKAGYDIGWERASVDYLINTKPSTEG